MGRARLFWIMHDRKEPGAKKSSYSLGNSTGRYYRNPKEKDKAVIVINTKIKELLSRVSRDEQKTSDIIGQLSVYKVNMQMALEFKDTKAYKARRRELMQYVNKELKELEEKENGLRN